MRRITDSAGQEWEVSPSGHRTQYQRDELSIQFVRVGEPREKRLTRFSPRHSTAVDTALEEASERQLLELLRVAQPAWTSPDGDYAAT